MMKRKGKIHIGTSGWHYKHWTGTFYPEGTKDTEQLSYYIESFKTVEINNSFYNLPASKTFKDWATATPAGFIFAVKGSRFITHMKKLKVLKSNISKFLLRAEKLGKKLGPVLFQLPPKWKVNPGRLADFLSKLPPGHRYTFEFRDPTWYRDDVYELLREHNCAFCIYELAGHLSPEEVTADFVYVRLHGPGKKYQGDYPAATLRKWARRCRQWQKEGRDVYIYFDNDQAGYAAFDAQELAELV